MFTNEILPTLGVITATLRHLRQYNSDDVEFYITATDNDPVLGIEACQALELLRIMHENIRGVTEDPVRIVDSSNCSLTANNVIAQFSDLFDGKLGL
jgi:hypothetical protein